MDIDADTDSEAILEKTAISFLKIPAPAIKILFRSISVLSLFAITVLYLFVQDLKFLLDFFYLIPVTVAGMISFGEGLAGAILVCIIRFFINSMGYALFNAGEIAYFITLSGYYLILPLIIELIRRLVWQRQQIQRNIKLTTAALMEALQMRDQYTGWHSQKVAVYARRLAARLGLSTYHQECLYLAGLLHDIGKIGIDDTCLNKPGPLTPEEWLIIRRHPGLGFKIVKKVIGNEDTVSRAILYHHERYDGGGYPRGLKGRAIPLEARILSVVDCFDAMTTNRVYRAALSPAEAIKELERCAGSQFDPDIVKAFLNILAEDGLYE